MTVRTALALQADDLFTKTKIAGKFVTIYAESKSAEGDERLKALMKPEIAAQAEWAGFFAEKGKSYLVAPKQAEAAALYVRLPVDEPEKAVITAMNTLPETVEAAEIALASENFDFNHFVKLHLANGYVFDRYKKSLKKKRIGLVLPKEENEKKIQSFVAYIRAVALGRDLVNTPAEDCSTGTLESAMRAIAEPFDATVNVTVGEELLQQNFPLLHAVGRAADGADRAPRLIDLIWGNPQHPKLTLVGKGICYDTGGLDIKTGSTMKLMKKDMGGAASVIALAYRIMTAALPVRLRVIVPAAENAIAGNAYRPGDIYPSRKGLTVEIGDTDAEGRLILADALAYADEETPDLLIDIATLTGAARVALGFELPAMYAKQKNTGRALFEMSEKTGDPVWEMPLWKGYEDDLTGKISDLCNVPNGTGGPAGSVTAALFLQKFVTNAKDWVHFDSYCYNASAKPGRPQGGEVAPHETLFSYITERYGIK